MLGERTAEEIKINVGSAFPLDEELTMEIKGRDLVEGIPKTLVISDEEIREALSEPIRAIVKAIREALECVPPELSGDIFERGVVLTGGVAMLRKFDEHLHKETGLPVLIAEDPMATVVVGVGKLLTDRGLLTKVAIADN